MTDPSRIEAIRERHAKATEGPWTVAVHDYTMADIHSTSPNIWAAEMSPVVSVSPCAACEGREKKAAETEGRSPEWKWGRCTCSTQADFDFIANSHDDVRWLLAELETAQAYLDAEPAVLTVEGGGDATRFFIDHGMIHDRITGKHVTTDEDSVFCDGINACCGLLNDLQSRLWESIQTTINVDEKGSGEITSLRSQLAKQSEEMAGIRRAAMEEAAKVCDAASLELVGWSPGLTCGLLARNIRALIDPKTGEG